MAGRKHRRRAKEALRLGPTLGQNTLWNVGIVSFGLLRILLFPDSTGCSLDRFGRGLAQESLQVCLGLFCRLSVGGLFGIFYRMAIHGRPRRRDHPILWIAGQL